MQTSTSQGPPRAGLTDRPLAGRPVAGHALAALLFVAALAARFALDPVLPPGFPYVTFFLAVILTAFLAGVGPGIACATLSGLAAWYWFLPPAGTLKLDYRTAVALGFYVFIVSLFITLVGWAQRERDRTRAEADRNAALAADGRVLFEELQHRVANNMALMAAMLALYRREAAADPARAPALFADAEQRLATMGRVHRALHDPAAADRPVAEHLADLARALVAADPRPLRVDVHVAPGIATLRLDLARLTSLSLLVAEAVTNSLKHGFDGRAAGALALALEHDGDNIVVRVADDGRGLPPAPAAGGKGLGSRIMTSLAKQLNGSFQLQSAAAGTEAVVRFAP